VLVRSPDSAAHGHDHCQLAVDRRAQAAERACAVVLRAAPDKAAPGLPTAVPGPALALLALAPKTSPPWSA
jgi:hypothetical protein